MKRAAWLLLVLAMPAIADERPNSIQPSYSNSNAYSNSQSQGGAGGEGGRAFGGAGGSSYSTGGAASGGNSSASAGSSVSAVQVNSRASAYAPDVLATPTAPCRVSVGASAGWLGGALGIGTSVLDEGCHVRETARMLAGLGMPEAAVQAMCLDEVARRALVAAGVRCAP